MDRYEGDFYRISPARYASDYDRPLRSGYDRGYRMGGGMGGYGRDFQDRGRFGGGYRGGAGGYDRDLQYRSGRFGYGRSERGSYDRSFMTGGRPWMRTRPWRSPWDSPVPGQDFGYSLGYGVGHNPYIYK